MPRILLLEDDHLQALGIRKGLEEALQPTHGPLEFTTISTESQFRAMFDEIARTSFDLAIIDVMVRWADPAPNMPEPPEEVRETGSFRAGLRCKKMLEEDPRTQTVPMLIYTLLESSRLPPDVNFVAKAADLTPLVERIKQLLPPR